MTMQSQWFYSQNGAQAGPVSATTLRDMVVAGQLSQTDMVWSEGMPSWLPLRQVQVLQGMFPAPPPAYGNAPNPYAQQGYGAPQAYGAPQYGAPQYGAPQYGAPQYGLPQYGYQPSGQSSNGLAIAGFIIAFFAPLIGFIISLVALSNMKKYGNPEGKGFATAGVIISICWFGFLVLIIVIAVASGN